MGVFTVTEYHRSGRTKEGLPIQAGEEPAVEIQSNSFTTAVPSAAFNNATTFIRFYSDISCKIKFGKDNTIDASVGNATPVSAGHAEYFFVKGGMYVSVYDGVT